MSPQRIQRKRTRGWRLPEGSVYVGRPTRWGNPFRVGDYATFDRWGDSPYPSATADELWDDPLFGDASRWSHERITDAAKTVRWFRAWFLATQIHRPYYGIAELRGHDLVCWCPLDQPCHADVLLELANQ